MLYHNVSSNAFLAPLALLASLETLGAYMCSTGVRPDDDAIGSQLLKDVMGMTSFAARLKRSQHGDGQPRRDGI